MHLEIPSTENEKLYFLESFSHTAELTLPNKNNKKCLEPQPGPCTTIDPSPPQEASTK